MGMTRVVLMYIAGVLCLVGGIGAADAGDKAAGAVMIAGVIFICSAAILQGIIGILWRLEAGDWPPRLEKPASTPAAPEPQVTFKKPAITASEARTMAGGGG
jgi:hypothetical protein